MTNLATFARTTRPGLGLWTVVLTVAAVALAGLGFLAVAGSGESGDQGGIVRGFARQCDHDPSVAVVDRTAQEGCRVHAQGSGRTRLGIRSGVVVIARRDVPECSIDRAHYRIKVAQNIGFHPPERREPLCGQAILQVP